MALFIFCVLCSKELRLRRDKHKKPYFVCDACGVQMFVRGRQGIENLAQLMATLREHDLTIRVHAHILYEIQAVLAEMRGLEKEIEKLDSMFEFLASQKRNKDKARVRKLLNARIETLLLQLDRIAHSDAKSA